MDRSRAARSIRNRAAAGSARARADARGRVVVSGSLIIAAIAAATALSFAFTGTELIDPDGRTLDCGSLIQPATTQLALATCGGVNDSNVVPLVVSALVLVAAIGVVIALLWRRSRRIHW